MTPAANRPAMLPALPWCRGPQVRGLLESGWMTRSRPLWHAPLADWGATQARLRLDSDPLAAAWAGDLGLDDRGRGFLAALVQGAWLIQAALDLKAADLAGCAPWPADWCQTFSLEAGQLARGHNDLAVQRLIRRVLEEARTRLKAGAPLARTLPGLKGLCLRLWLIRIERLGWGLGQRAVDQPFDPVTIPLKEWPLLLWKALRAPMAHLATARDQG